MRHRASDEGGFSLIELMVALMIFAVVIAGVAAGTDAALELARNNRHRSTAAHLAAAQIERTRALPVLGVPLNQTVTTAQVGGVTYTVTQDAAWTSPTATQPSCNVPNATPSGQVLAYLRVRVRVTWTHMGAVQPVQSETLLTPPVGALAPTRGHVGVTVVDRNGRPLEGLSVGLGPVNGAATATQLTTEDGCAFFVGVAPGNYDVILATTGWVDRQGSQPSRQTVGVTAGNVSTARFDYDQAATIQVTAVALPGTAAVPTTMQVTVANPNLTSLTKVLAWSATATDVGPLFPYASGYQLWAGGCADADPTFARYTGGSRGLPVATDPGVQGSATVTLTGQPVTVVAGAGTPEAGVTLRAVHTGSATCPAGAEILTFAAATDALGQIQLALPFGAWQIEAVNRTTQTPATVTIQPATATLPVQVTVQ